MNSARQNAVHIFDTTLRDGEQAPGCSMSIQTKLRVAHQLRQLRVDVIEAGFPAASPGECEAVTAVAEAIGRGPSPVVCGLARATHRDIDLCARALSGAANGRVHIFVATSDIHLRHKLRQSREEVLRLASESVSYAKALCGEVQFSAEDAARSDPGYLCEVMSAAVDAGATVVNVPDTVGYSTPGEYGALVRRVVETPGIKSRARVSAHCHNDLGLAVANSLAAVLSGARQVECTINGIGERAGNAALEEVVMALQTRADLFRAHTGVATAELVGTSRMVADCLQMTIPPNKAIVGANAFAHEAGIHQDGVLKNPATYEIMNPATVGWTGTNLVLGKHSGRNALRMAIADRFGVQLTDDELRSAFDAFKNIADTRHLVTDPELRAIVHQCLAISTSVSPSYSQNEMRAEAENI